MTRKELTDRLTEIVSEYIENAAELRDPQLRINPASLDIGVVTAREMDAELEDFDEMMEGAVAAHGLADQDDSDYQVSRTPDFYSLKELTKKDASGRLVPDADAIGSIASEYAG